MASLLESFGQALQPDIVGQFGKTLGLDGPSMTKGLGVVGPLLASAMANTAATPSGLDNLMGMVQQVSGSSTPSDLMKMARGGASSRMISSLFGSGASAVGGTIDRALGFRASSLLGVAAPFVFSQLSQRVSAGSLDKAGVATLLREERKSLAGGEADALVQQALRAGEEASTTRARYSTEQWNMIRLGPIAAASLVIGASPSAAAGIAKEVRAFGDAIASLRNSASPESVFSLATAEPINTQDLMALPQEPAELIAMLQRSVATVRANNPVDGATYAQSILELAAKVAAAAKEGGFLGIGATRVSGAEQAAFDQIRVAVR